MAIDHDGSQIAALMRPYHIRLLDMAAADASTTLGIDASFDLEMEEVQQVLDTLAKQIRNVADTTRADVQRLTGQAAEHGWSPADLAREIRALGEIASQTRAELISITESAAAYSRGSLLSYAQSGQVSGTEWLTTDPCPICAPLDGKVAPLGEAFADGIESPPAHPRCRCAIAPVLKEDAQPQDDPVAYAQALDDAELSIRNNELESAIVLSPDGKTVFSQGGGRDFVNFTPEQEAMLSGNVLTHNHPRTPEGTSFSPDDIRFLLRTGLREIRAVGGTYRYSLLKPTGFDGTDWADIADEVAKTERDTRIFFTELIRNGTYTPEKADLMHWHSIWAAIARKYNWVYSREEWSQ